MRQFTIQSVSGSDPSAFQLRRERDGNTTGAVEIPSPYERQVGQGDRSLMDELRWYLENFLDYPFDPWTDRADQTLAALEDWGSEAFEVLFGGGDGKAWLDRARQHGDVQITISADDPGVLSWPWEGLYDPQREWLVHQHAVTRCLNDVDDPPPLPELPNDRINILLVTARPFSKDIPYRSTGRPLVEQVREQDLPASITMLRPATVANLKNHLRENPTRYHVVHFDGHGGYLSKSGGVPEESPRSTGAQGYLAFESKDEAGPEWVPAYQLSQILSDHRIPAVVLDACQSGMVDDTADDAFASVAASLVQAGVRSVIAMSHAVMVSGAQEFIPPFYEHLFETGSLAEAARAGRGKMLARPERLCARGRFPLQDWLVPVVYEQAEGPFDFVADAAPPPDGAPDLPDPPQEVKNPFGFIGRDSELLQLERAVRHDPPGILFHGLGGVGKTTLVWGFLRWLADTGGLSRKPFWFTFSKIHSAEHVLNRIGERLDGPEFPTRDTKEKLDVLVKRLDEQPHILVWDNFESAAAMDEEVGEALLSEDDRETLRTLLHRLHGTWSKLLVTSRNREDWLGDDEYVQRHTLGGLRGEERWQFCERIAANLPDVSLNRDDDDLKKLMDTLRGHPLAMRVVLSRLANQSPKDLQKTVQNNLDELKSAEDDGIGRLYATLGLLYEALDDDLRELLIPLHLHEGYVDASQIEEMANEAESPLTREQIDRGLRDLANVGLLQNVRDHVLYAAHPALTGYLRAQRNDLKSTAPVDEWTRAFVQVLAAKADSLLPPTPLHELRGFLSYHERNVLHADRLADQESWIDERRTFEKFLASAAERRGLYTAAVRRYEAWLEMSKQLDDKVGIAKVQAQLSSIAMKKRNYEKAEKGFLKAGKKFASLNDARSVAVTYHHLGRVAQERRKPEEAEKWYRKSVEMKKRINDERGMATTYQQIGFVALQQGNHQKAEKWCKKSIEIKERIGNKSGAAKTYHVLGVIAQDKRDYKKADKWYRKSAEIKERLGDYHGAATTYHQLGQVAEECREFEKAEKWHHKSAAIGERLDDELGAAKSYHHLGLVAQERGRLEEAEKWYRKSAEIEERLDEEYFAAKTFYQLGRVAQEQREFEEAEKWYCKAVEMEETIGEETFVAKMYHQLGLVVHEQGAYEEAEKWYRKSLEIEERVGDEHGAAETYRELGNLALDQEDWLEAGRRILRAIRGFKISTDIRNAQRTMSDFGKIYDAAPQDIQDALRKRWIDAGHPEEKLDELRAQLE